MASLDIDILKQKRALVVKLGGRLDASSALEIEQHCGPELEGEKRHVVLDLAKLRYISSAGLRSVLWLGKTCGANGRKLFITGLNGSVQQVFALSGFNSLFPVFATPEDALAGI